MPLCPAETLCHHYVEGYSFHKAILLGSLKLFPNTLMCCTSDEKNELWLYFELYFPTGCNTVRAERDAASAVASQYGNFPAAGSWTTLAE